MTFESQHSAFFVDFPACSPFAVVKQFFCSEPQATQKCRRATRQKAISTPYEALFSLLAMVRLMRLKLNFTECAAQIRRVVLSMSTTEWKFSLLLLLRLHSFPSRILLSFFFSSFFHVDFSSRPPVGLLSVFIMLNGERERLERGWSSSGEYLLAEMFSSHSSLPSLQLRNISP